MSEAENTPSRGVPISPRDSTLIAYYSEVSLRSAPGWYARTYMLALAFAPFIAGIAGLFDHDCAVWVYSKDKGFRAVELTRRAK